MYRPKDNLREFSQNRRRLEEMGNLFQSLYKENELELVAISKERGFTLTSTGLLSVPIKQRLWEFADKYNLHPNDIELAFVIYCCGADNIMRQVEPGMYSKQPNP